tara:strand:+ start:638 stop:1570 length:933 start_codon:yes stop_codon:yes gene_type:complete
LINQKNIKVTSIDDETRIDRWLKRKFSLLTQSFIENKIRRGLIRINQKKIKSKHKVLTGDIVTIYEFSEKIFSKIKITKIKKTIPKKILAGFKNSIIYESTDFIIINKWTGISVQGGSKQEISIDDIISNISDKYSLVHRLDKETTGLLVISKHYKSAKIFGKLFKDHEIEKYYLAICQGVPNNLDSIVKLGINRKNSDKKLKTITKYKVINTFKKISLIIYQPLTGRMHQLRIVSKYLNCPIIGDTKYASNNKYLNEQLKLNAFYLKFTFNNHQYEFRSKLPSHILKFMKKIRMLIPTKERLENLSKTF